MLLPLKLHPQSRCEAVTRLEAEATAPQAGWLALRYLLTGRTDRIVLPPVDVPERTDELWKHTCFEVFVKAGGAGYYEFNFAPSSRWAAYRFTGYRDGMTPVAETQGPQFSSRRAEGSYELNVLIDLQPLPKIPMDAPLSIGLSAVIEEVSGEKSYWALAHADGKPDFHHSAAFAYELDPA
jgi:hypothetical protein